MKPSRGLRFDRQVIFNIVLLYVCLRFSPSAEPCALSLADEK